MTNTQTGGTEVGDAQLSDTSSLAKTAATPSTFLHGNRADLASVCCIRVAQTGWGCRARPVWTHTSGTDIRFRPDVAE